MQTKFALIAGLGLVVILALSAFSSVSSRPLVSYAFSPAKAVLLSKDIRLAHIFDLAQASTALVSVDTRKARIFDIAQARTAKVTSDIRHERIFEISQARAAAAASKKKDVSLPHTLYLAQVRTVLAASNDRKAHLFDLASY
jgi:hypothetical protein